jgi:hypothetical protein
VTARQIRRQNIIEFGLGSRRAADNQVPIVAGSEPVEMPGKEAKPDMRRIEIAAKRIADEDVDPIRPNPVFRQSQGYLPLARRRASVSVGHHSAGPVGKGDIKADDLARWRDRVGRRRDEIVEVVKRASQAPDVNQLGPAEGPPTDGLRRFEAPAADPDDVARPLNPIADAGILAGVLQPPELRCQIHDPVPRIQRPCDRVHLVQVARSISRG